MWQKQEGDRDFSEDIREAGNTYVVYMKKLMVGNRKQSRISMKLWKSSGPKYIDAVERQELFHNFIDILDCFPVSYHELFHVNDIRFPASRISSEKSRSPSCFCHICALIVYPLALNKILLPLQILFSHTLYPSYSSPRSTRFRSYFKAISHRFISREI